jgi:predicted ABC-type sugar transport system permease subunit
LILEEADQGSIMALVPGCLMVGVPYNRLVLLAVAPFRQQVMKGLASLIAVAVDKEEIRAA